MRDRWREAHCECDRQAGRFSVKHIKGRKDRQRERERERERERK